MFTGIIETTGIVESIQDSKGNRTFRIRSPFAAELSLGQSLAHNGVCLTVAEAGKETYSVVAIAETLSKTNLGLLKEGDQINLERALASGGRLDGHIVQGHVDQTGICKGIKQLEGSWIFNIQYKPSADIMIVEKGSVCVNGVSLTVVDAAKECFDVAIIPHTYHHTNFSALKKGDKVNLEFDVIGKYVARLMQPYR